MSAAGLALGLNKMLGVKAYIVNAIALLAILCLPQQARAEVFKPESFLLPNGLEVVVVTNMRAPVVAHMLWVKAGAADELPGVSGVAHYLEHLMFKGSVGLADGEYSATLARMGGRDNAFTSQDYTAYWAMVAKQDWPSFMALEAKRLRGMQVTPLSATTELAVVQAENKNVIESNPMREFGQEIASLLYGAHAYGRPTIGLKEEVANLRLADAEAFYKRWYAPNNMVLVVSGAVSSDEVRKVLASTMAKIPSREIEPPAKQQPQPLVTQRRVVKRDAVVQQPLLVKAWPAVTYGQNVAAAYALEVLAEMLGGDAGWLHRDLVVDKELAAEVSVDFDAAARYGADFRVVLAPRPDVKMQKAEEALAKSLSLFVEKGLTAEALNAAKQRLQESAVFARDSLLAPGYAFGMALATGQKVADVEAWPQRIGDVSLPELRAAAERIWQQPGQVTGLLLPAEYKDAD